MRHGGISRATYFAVCCAVGSAGSTIFCGCHCVAAAGEVIRDQLRGHEACSVELRAPFRRRSAGVSARAKWLTVLATELPASQATRCFPC